MAVTGPQSASANRRRRRTSSYVKLEADKKAETRSKYLTAALLGLLVLALLASLGVVAFGLAT